jgi:ABC-type transport system involved in cytochrome c biogenesis permease subunit
MIVQAAWWGMGYAALLIATITFGWSVARSHAAARAQRLAGTDRPLREAQAAGLTGQVLTALSALALWVGLLSRAVKGHGWPLVTSADATSAISLLTLSIYLIWESLSRDRGTGFAVTSVSLVLLSYGLSQQPLSMATASLASKGVLLSTSLNLCAGSLLALAATASLTRLLRNLRAQRTLEHRASSEGTGSDPSESLVRAALLCLAVSLAIDTWWLQKVGLGGSNDAQQAGIAVVWMIYFVALRLRASAHWRGWPWTAILAAGFFCTLPILINVPWLGKTLPI